MKFANRRKAQEGAVLIVALLFLVVLTMLGITAMTGTTFEERMAGNARDAAVAMHSAEASLRAARDVVLGLRAPAGSSIIQAGTGPNEANFADASDANGVCVKGLCSPRPYDKTTQGAVPPEIPAGVSWTETDFPGATTDAYAANNGATRLQGVSKQSRFIIELFCTPLVGGGMDQTDTCRVWRFTAVGWGKNPNTQVTVQETYISEKRK
jgi:Tfp pilus assembly protein PilX